MKPFFLALALCAGLSLHAQSRYIQVGGIATFSQNDGTALGGGADINFQTKSNFVFGAGAAIVAFEYQGGTYFPLFGRIGYAVPLKALVLTAHGDIGYGLYNQKKQYIGSNTSGQGGFYASPGVSLHLKNRYSPFFDVRYSVQKFGIKFNSGSSCHFHYDGLTLSVGFCFLNKK